MAEPIGDRATHAAEGDARDFPGLPGAACRSVGGATREGVTRRGAVAVVLIFVPAIAPAEAPVEAAAD
jgi:hypothetical protein